MQVLFQNPQLRPGVRAAFCVFSHYDPHGTVEPYVRGYLAELQRCGFQVVFVSTSPRLDTESQEALRELTAAVILRENIGYDFGSYKTGILFLRHMQAEPSRLLLTNDSVFGPLQPLAPLLPAHDDFGLFGMTDSFDFSYHLQSFFILYGTPVLRSPEFAAFWDRVELLSPDVPGFKQKIILDYEVGGSQYFLNHGFPVAAAFPFRKTLATAMDHYGTLLAAAEAPGGVAPAPLKVRFNATHSFWEELIELGFPFIKRELLLLNPTGADIYRWPDIVAQHSDYDIGQILAASLSFSGNNDVFFTTAPAEIAARMNEAGELVLPVNPTLKPWQARFGVPDERCFVFDESVYMDAHPDIRVAVQQGKLDSARAHFKKQGHRESRRVPLKAIPSLSS